MTTPVRTSTPMSAGQGYALTWLGSHTPAWMIATVPRRPNSAWVSQALGCQELGAVALPVGAVSHAGGPRALPTRSHDPRTRRLVRVHCSPRPQDRRSATPHSVKARPDH